MELGLRLNRGSSAANFGLLMRIAVMESVSLLRAGELLTAFVELERQVLTVTFYLEFHS